MKGGVLLGKSFGIFSGKLIGDILVLRFDEKKK